MINSFVQKLLSTYSLVLWPWNIQQVVCLENMTYSSFIMESVSTNFIMGGVSTNFIMDSVTMNIIMESDSTKVIIDR